MTRRDFILCATTIAAFRNDTLSAVEKLVGRYSGEPNEEDFWIQIREAFDLDPNIANFNNGGCSPSPRIVQEALKRQIAYSNQAPSLYMWRDLEPEVEHVRARLAGLFGVDTEEIAITRNASESLETCLAGHDLKPGDEVLCTDQDYPRMVTTLQQMERRYGIKLVQVPVPAAPETKEELVEAYRKGITPQTKMMLVCHVIFMTGQIYPIHDITALGREHGIPVVVDGAHAFAQFPFKRDDLGCDYYGTSLHKWLQAPIGTGMLFVKKDKIKDLWPLMAAGKDMDSNIRKFEEIGTHPAANHNAIGEAITFHELIGGQRKADRLRHLRKRWTDKIQNESKVVFHTNLHPEHSCAITTVEIKGISNGDLGGWLMNKHGIFVTSITHPRFQGIRVSPNIYSTVDEIDRFASAMLTAARQGIS
ncbi:MAG TPA: aminotransferase class V-fold PLP-dependent enzyme [Fimbriimonadaceae bacterium]|jgi:selenocysteine lyase/cysteine desulfurase